MTMTEKQAISKAVKAGRLKGYDKSKHTAVFDDDGNAVAFGLNSTFDGFDNSIHKPIIRGESVIGYLFDSEE